ncbi:MAG: ABC transporter substrate-binding protein, partial [Gemmatimonadota bacterium]
MPARRESRSPAEEASPDFRCAAGAGSFPVVPPLASRPPRLAHRRFLRRTVVCALLLGAACRDDPRPVFLGYAFRVGPDPLMRVAQDALDSAATAGGRPIRLFRLKVSDAGTDDPEIEQAETLAGMPEIIGVIGHPDSRGSLAAAAIYDKVGVPQVIPTATARLLKQAGPWSLWLAPDDSVEAAFMARFVSEAIGARRVTLFFGNNAYGRDFRYWMTGELAARGVALVDEMPFDRQSDLALLVEASLARDHPAALIVVGQAYETGTIARLVHERLGRAIPVVAADGALEPPAALA